MPVQATEVLSDEDVRNILNGWTELDPEHVDLYVSSGVGRTLIHLERSGFECSEEEYLLCPDTNNEPSKAYLHGGNFALPPGTPGHTPWPGHCAPADGTALAHLPADVDASPPFALGRFIVERIATAVDLTNGTSLDVILLPKLGCSPTFVLLCRIRCSLDAGAFSRPRISAFLSSLSWSAHSSLGMSRSIRTIKYTLPGVKCRDSELHSTLVGEL